MPGCWRLRRPFFRPSVSCGADHDALSAVATIFHAHRGGASISQGIAPARSPSRRLATPADWRFSLFSCPLGLVEWPDAAREKRAALSGVVRHDDNPAARIGVGGLDRS